MPGPRAKASNSLAHCITMAAPCSSSTGAAGSGSGRVMALVSLTSMMGFRLSGTATVTSPAPALCAAQAVMQPAPVRPGEQAMISTRPKSPLCASAARGGSTGSSWASLGITGPRSPPSPGRPWR